MIVCDCLVPLNGGYRILGHLCTAPGHTSHLGAIVCSMSDGHSPSQNQMKHFFVDLRKPLLLQIQLNLRDIGNIFHGRNFSASALLCPFKIFLSSATERWFWLSLNKFTIILVTFGMDMCVYGHVCTGDIGSMGNCVVDLMVTHHFESCQHLFLLYVNRAKDDFAFDLTPEG